MCEACKTTIESTKQVDESTADMEMYCEYCGQQFVGDFDIAIGQGWQHGLDASFCPAHNV